MIKIVGGWLEDVFENTSSSIITGIVMEYEFGF